MSRHRAARTPLAIALDAHCEQLGACRRSARGAVIGSPRSYALSAPPSSYQSDGWRSAGFSAPSRSMRWLAGRTRWHTKEGAL